MLENNSLIVKDRRRKAAAKSSKIMKKIIPYFIASLMSIFILMNLCFAVNDNGSAFFEEAFNVLEILIILIGAGLALWGIVNLLEGYGNDNPGAKSQGIKQLMSGAGIILLGVLLVPLLSQLFFNDSGI